MIGKAYRFPLVVLALTRRKVGFVAMTTPLHIESAQLWSLRHLHKRVPRGDYLRGRALRAVGWFRPETLLLTHGSRWRMDALMRRRCQEESAVAGQTSEIVDVADACEAMGCTASLREIVGRLVDSYPRMESRLRHATSLHVQAADVRDVRPLVSALAVAHAASIEHITKFA